MTNPMLQDITAQVLRNVDLGRGSYLLEFEAPELIDGMQPGQFFMIGVPGSDVLLRRPFSVCGLPGTFEDGNERGAQILYRVYGRGTQLLASLRGGATVRVLGPLGRGFARPERPDAEVVLVAGGIGSAPFPALLDLLSGAGVAATMVYGARNAGELPLLEWFKTRCETVIVTTDDGSAGTKGLVTTPLATMMARSDRGRLHLYACGPTPMLKAVARMACDAGVRCDLALEAPMACGFGVCLGCVVPTRETDSGPVDYKRVCVDGPVMRAERLAW